MLVEELAISAFVFVLFFVINAVPIYTRAQTVGKLICRIQVVDMTTWQPISGNRYIFRRWLPFFLIAQVPRIGGIVGLVDALMIFRNQKNCLHDDIAATRVIKI